VGATIPKLEAANHFLSISSGGSLIPIVVYREGEDLILTNQVSWIMVDFLTFLLYCGTKDRLTGLLKETYN